jgi:preprotein translocase subunit SecY
MWEKIFTLFKVPELRQKILITLMFLAIYRVGFWVPLPVVDQQNLQEWSQSTRGTGFGQLMNYMSMFSASSIGNSTIFGLGIMPYISASIIFQLLASVYPPLEKLQKEGESGRKKINEYTRYATVGLCLIQSFMWVQWLSGQGLLLAEYNTFGYRLLAVMTMTAGTVFLMWIGEQIDEYGIGNGISLLIMAGIVARMPRALQELLSRSTFQLGQSSGGQYSLETIIVLMVLFVGVVLGVVAMTQAQRRIPTQSAKHVRGRRVFGGQRQYLPLRVNQAGVMPIIFASSLLMIPLFLTQMLAGALPWSNFLQHGRQIFGARSGYIYNVLYVVLIYFFCYFWTAITFKPKDMADNLKDVGSFIPGYRPGKRTADYLEKVMIRITYVGAAFLAIVAVIPTLISGAMNIDYFIAAFYGGTGLLIVVSVALDLIQKIDSHLVMRNYSGLME